MGGTNINLGIVLQILQVLSIISTLMLAVPVFFIKRELKQKDAADTENKNSIKDLKKDVDDKLQKQKYDTEELIKDLAKSINGFKDDVGEKFVRKDEYLKTANDLTKSIDGLKEGLGDKFVRKDEYLKSSGEITKRLDKIFDILFEMQEKIAKNGVEKNNAKSG